MKFTGNKCEQLKIETKKKFKKNLKILEPIVTDQLTINPIKERQIDRN